MVLKRFLVLKQVFNGFLGLIYDEVSIYERDFERAPTANQLNGTTQDVAADMASRAARNKNKQVEADGNNSGSTSSSGYASGGKK